MIPVNEPLLNGNEKKYLAECIDTGWISSVGPFVKEFEKQFGSYLGLPPGIAVCNGTAALEAAMYGLGIGKDDEVVMPSFTIISCAIAVIRLGAKPVLVDIEPETWTMDVLKVQELLERKTRSKRFRVKAIMPVHIYGHPVNMDLIFRLARKYDLKIVEDAAEVHGAEYFSREVNSKVGSDKSQETGEKGREWRAHSKEYSVANKGRKEEFVPPNSSLASNGCRWLKCGAMGDVASFSFYANKIITTGEGGMVVSRNLKVLERAASYRNLCFNPEKRFYHKELGYNFRMTNLQAAVGVAQMERIEEFIALKRSLGMYYRQRLADIPGVRFQVEKPWAKSVYWIYAIQLEPDLGVDAQVVMDRLKKQGVGTRPFFIGLHAQPSLKRLGLFHGEKYPCTDQSSKYGFYLPSGMTLTERKIDEVCDILQDVLKSS